MCVYDYSEDTPSLGKAHKIRPTESDRTANPGKHESGVAPSPQGGGHRKDPPKPPAPPGMADPGDEPESDPMSRRFVVIYRNGQFTSGYYPAADAATITAGDYDLDVDVLTRTFVIKKSDGSMRLLRGTIPGVGTVPLQQLLKMARWAGVVLTPAQWKAIEPEYDKEGWGLSLAPIIARLRKLFFGEKGSQHFIVTIKPLAYGWNRDRSYRIIALQERWWEI